jgi:hypothetical protein
MEIETFFRGGEPEADACEHLLAWAARKRGTLDVALAEGLAAPDVPFDAASTEDEIDARLRAIAQLRAPGVGELASASGRVYHA